jgi:hypothetical protein
MLRQFTDARGISWRVWDVWPTRMSQSATATNVSDMVVAFPDRDFVDGWLCFESSAEKRRLAPIPPEWETCEPCVLEELCMRAGFITPTPRRGFSLG